MPCWDHKKAGAASVGFFVVPLSSPSVLRTGPPGDIVGLHFVSGRCLPVVASLLPPGTALTRPRFAQLPLISRGGREHIP